MEGKGQKDMRLVIKHWTLAWGQGRLFNESEVWTAAQFEPVFTNWSERLYRNGRRKEVDFSLPAPFSLLPRV